MLIELINKYRHFWRTFSKIVADFDNTSWKNSGYALTTPARTSYHIINSTKFYIKDQSPFICNSGRKIILTRDKLDEKDLPSIEDITNSIPVIAESSENWLRNINLESVNEDFKWTGRTIFSVVLFLLSHCEFHLGEISALLNEVKEGAAADHFADALRDPDPD